MKIAIISSLAVLGAVLIGCASTKAGKAEQLEKAQHRTVQLSKGAMDVYDYGKVKLHAFKTNDPISDECFLVEKKGQAFLIESPAFFDNIAELEKYIKDLGVEYKGTVIAYHGAGATFMKGSPVYSTKNATDYNTNGGGAALVNSFAGAFGSAFDKSIYKTTNFIEGDSFTLAGVKMRITRTGEAFDIEIPEINAVYTHMLGHDSHSIVAGAAHAMIASLNGYIEKNISLILTSHYAPENLDDVKTKIAYLQDLKDIASKNSTAASFKAAVQKKYGAYSGLNYLDMTANFFYK
ncbi:hypothetical protein [Treponema parvum]|nr:hypothetical protein [Treponema parvum]